MKVIGLLIAVLTALTSASAWGMEELRILSSTSTRLTPPPAVVERFEREFGLRVRFEFFESPEALTAYLEGNPRGDLAVVRDHYVERLIAGGHLRPLERQLLPNLKNIDPRDLDRPFDPGGVYGMPYLKGLLGIVYRRDLLGKEKPTWAQLFAPSTQAVPCAVTNQYRDALGAALIYLGHSYNATSAAAINQAADLLQSLSADPAFMGFLDPETTLRYLRERFIYIAVTYNNLAAVAMAADPGLAFTVPEGGGVIWSVVYVISEKSAKTRQAHQWLDFLMRPDVAAEVAAWNLATSPNQAALPFLSPDIRDNPVLYPPEEIWRTAEVPLNPGREAEQLLLEHWSRLK